MLTAIVHANSTPSALAITLSSLVPGVAEGLISHAIVAMPTADASAERIADAMGAGIVIAESGHWRAAAREARGAWVLLLEAGETPAQGWMAAIERHWLCQSPDSARPALLPAARLGPMLRERAAIMFAPSTLRSGLLCRREPVAEGTSGGVPVRLTVARLRMPT